MMEAIAERDVIKFRIKPSIASYIYEALLFCIELSDDQVVVYEDQDLVNLAKRDKAFYSHLLDKYVQCWEDADREAFDFETNLYGSEIFLSGIEMYLDSNKHNMTEKVRGKMDRFFNKYNRKKCQNQKMRIRRFQSFPYHIQSHIYFSLEYLLFEEMMQDYIEQHDLALTDYGMEG